MFSISSQTDDGFSLEINPSNSKEKVDGVIVLLNYKVLTSVSGEFNQIYLNFRELCYELNWVEPWAEEEFDVGYKRTTIWEYNG